MYCQSINTRYNKRVSRIDQPTLPNSQNSQFYQPLRKSLLRTNLSQSNISSRSYLSSSRVNDLSNSRVSRRMRSLSPDQVDKITKITLVPLNKRLLPTNNVGLVRDKRFQAIDVQQRIHKPIPAIKFNINTKFNSNRVEQIVYQTQDQIFNKFNSHAVTSKPLKITSPRSTNNIYTTRVSFGGSQIQNRTFVQPRQYSPNQAFNMGLDSRQVDTRRFNSIPPAAPQNLINQNMISTASFNNNVRTSVVQSERLNVVPYNPQVSVVKQIPTSNMLTTFSPIPSNLGSRTSFDHEIQRGMSVRQYDFTKHSSQISSGTQYQTKKKQDFKYNIFSVLDEPVNTDCSKLGCLNNEIFASKPHLYEWKQ